MDKEIQDGVEYWRKHIVMIRFVGFECDCKLVTQVGFTVCLTLPFFMNSGLWRMIETLLVRFL